MKWVWGILGTALIGVGSWLMLETVTALEWISPLVCRALLRDSYVTPLRQSQLVVMIRVAGFLFIMLGCFSLGLLFRKVRTKARDVLIIVTGTSGEPCSSEGRPFRISRLFLFSTSLSIFLVLSYFLSTHLFPSWLLYTLYREDLFFESLTVILVSFASLYLFLAASCLKSWIGTREGRSTQVKWVVWAFRLLGAAFLFIALEEISWGQRVFGWATPSLFTESGTQWETNIHNRLQLSHLRLLYLPFTGLFVPAAISIWVRYRKTRWKEYFLLLPHPNLLVAAVLISLWAFLMLVGADAFVLWGECMEELVAVFALSYSIGVFEGEPLRGVSVWRSPRRRWGWVLVCCCLAAITISGFIHKYPSIYTCYNGLPEFHSEVQPSPGKIFDLNMGTRQARSFLVPIGWSLNESDGKTTWVWATGRKVSVFAPLKAGSAYRMEVTVEPFVVPERIQTMSLRFNDRHVRDFQLSAGTHTYSMRLPGEMVADPGKVDFSFNYWVAPLSLGLSCDWRALAVRFFRIRFIPEGTQGRKMQSPAHARMALNLPTRSVVAYPVEAVRRSREPSGLTGCQEELHSLCL